MELRDCDTVAMPSRTVMLKGIPRELNNNETIHNYFSKFGAILWVNERYENDPGAAIVTFFSISDAIAAIMSDEHPMDFSSIHKSWFEYTQQCEFCSYKYSSEYSIKQHMAMYHSDKNQHAIDKYYQFFNNSNDENNNNNNNATSLEERGNFFKCKNSLKAFN